MKMVTRVGFAGAVAAFSVSAFAQASGALVDTGIVTSVTSVTTNVQDVGVAVIGVMAAVFAVRIVKGMLGR
jgi:hypothetical protein